MIDQHRMTTLLVNIMANDEFDYECMRIRDAAAIDANHDDDDDDDSHSAGSGGSISFDSSSETSQEKFITLHPSNADYAQLFEDTLTMMDDYIRENIGKMSCPAFHEELSAYIFEQLRIVLFESVGDSVAVDSKRMHSLVYKIIENAANYYFTTLHQQDPNRFVSWRSLFNDDAVVVSADDAAAGNSSCHDDPPQALIDKVRALQQQQNQTEQRTAAWYARRHSFITASAAWKAFGSESVVNQLIYEKCKPYDDAAMQQEQQSYVNVDSPLHWGQKYEFLSAALYQRKNNTRIGEFGCIQHSDPRFSFIGGSPDGINIDESSPLFGRMVEIKNIVNREITGIPKEEYWIQMQIQMEVCDMDAGCDFVETRFNEYEDPQDYYDDVYIDYVYSDKYNKNDNKNNKNNKNDNSVSYCNGNDEHEIVRGIILYFIDTQSRKPHYEYMPFDYTDVETQEAWITNTITRFENYESRDGPTHTSNYLWIRNIYWKLDQYSCVFVPRNKMWFTEFAAPQLDRVWQIIERERVSGYAHRAPKKRIATVNTSKSKSKSNVCPAICSLDLSSPKSSTGVSGCNIII